MLPPLRTRDGSSRPHSLDEGQVEGACRRDGSQPLHDDRLDGGSGRLERGRRPEGEKKRLGNGVSCLLEGLGDCRVVVQKPRLEKGLESDPAPEQRKPPGVVRRAVLHLREMSGVQELLEHFDVLPVACPLRLLAANEVGEGEERERPSPVGAALPACEELGERREEVVLPPELEPLLAAVGEPADGEAAEGVRGPAPRRAGRNAPTPG